MISLPYLLSMDTVFGVPVHPLLVHAVVVLVPLAALMSILIVIKPAWRTKFKWLAAVLVVAGTATIPLATGSGESLRGRIFQIKGQNNALLNDHLQMGENLTPFGLTLLISTLAYLFIRKLNRGLLGKLVAVVIVVSALGSMVEVYLIGHSGAKSVWSKTVEKTHFVPEAG